jgi:4-amino-4-deoxy-L-arabinose transferase-like glycosyltransferase
VALGITAHLVIMLLPGNSIMTRWSGGGDMDAYVLLARNLISGSGYTYAHVPSAWRTPGYPLVIAGAMEVFGEHFAIAVRILQGLLAVLASYLCMWAARFWFGETAARIALLAALFFPTLLYLSGEFLSESITAFFVALCLWMFAKDSASPHWTTAAGMGLAIGLGTLVRPNMAVLGFVGFAGAWVVRRAGRLRLQVALVPLCAALVLAPWIARNYQVFGRFMLSTKSGADALCGVLNPESRTLPGWEDRMRALVGYLLPNDVETNSPNRLALGPEIELDRKCWLATRQVWGELGWGTRARVTLGKWETYWLSLDQLLQPGRISRLNRVLHVSMVLFYWVLLALACAGWWSLRRTRPEVALVFLGYVVLATVLHTAFVMDTRIRSPLIDPLIAILAGGSYLAFERESDAKNAQIVPVGEE